MKLRWWIAASLLVCFTLTALPGCGGGGELPMEGTAEEEMGDVEADLEMPPP